MENTLKTFHTISSFVKELQELYGKKYYNITLYNRILEKTPITHENAITKHIEIFHQFLNKNKDAILAKDESKLKWDKIIFSNKIYINIKDVLNDSDNDTKNSIWKYLLAISFNLIESDDIHDKIKEMLSSSSSSSDGESEKEFIQHFMTKIEDKFKDKDFKDPMSATAELLQSGLFTDMVKEMNTDIQSGKINVNKLLGSVQGMLGNLTNEAGAPGAGLPDMNNIFSTVTSMMNGQMSLDSLGGLGNLFSGLNTSDSNSENIPPLEELLKPITHDQSDTKVD